MKLLLDWDGTLWDTTVFQNGIEHELLTRFGVSSEKLHQVYLNYVANLKQSIDFNPYSFCKKLSEELSLPIDDIYTLFLENESLYKKALFDDAEPFLSSFNKKKNVQLGIYSEGVLSFQKNKIKRSGMIKYFDPSLIYIFKRKTTKENLEKLPKDVFVIDNKAEIVDKLHQFGIEAYHIQRPKDTLFNVNKVRSF